MCQEIPAVFRRCLNLLMRCDCSIVCIKIDFRGADMKWQVINKNRYPMGTCVCCSGMKSAVGAYFFEYC